MHIYVHLNQYTPPLLLQAGLWSSMCELRQLHLLRFPTFHGLHNLAGHSLLRTL